MIGAARAQDAQSRKLRADRILDSAAELLLRWGYKRVTIDDVAAQAGIGKGTVYLHYRTREELFFSVIMREQAAETDELIEAVRRDPREALLHRLIRLKYLSAMRRPILRAVIAADPEILGRLVDAAKGSDLGKLLGLVSFEYFQIMIEHSLIKPGISVPELIYGVGAITIGFFTGDAFLEAFGGSPALERKADLLEAAIERSFVLPASDDALRAIAPAVIELYAKSKEISQAYLERAYEARSFRTGETS
ncbi:MAG: helix-turn-helix domain-containing protein [Spirochaetia bacterium]|jgi:AcrR family transcriptional regulator